MGEKNKLTKAPEIGIMLISNCDCGANTACRKCRAHYGRMRFKRRKNCKKLLLSFCNLNFRYSSIKVYGVALIIKKRPKYRRSKLRMKPFCSNMAKQNMTKDASKYRLNKGKLPRRKGRHPHSPAICSPQRRRSD